MTHLLAEGGYQNFLLSHSEKTWLYVVLAAAVVAIIVAVSLVRGVLAVDQGTASMKEIALAVQEGAEAFLARQFKTILVIVVPLAVLIFFTATKVTHVANGHTVVDLTFVQAGFYRAICFLAGALCSGLTGFIGMSLAVRGNVRTAAAAREGKMAPALKVAFRTGAITGLFCVGLGLLGATIIVLVFQNTATSVLIGFGFGASLLALFMRVGGGIFTKAADVGADLVGKVEVGIPEDDPRNAATIADNVGDNVGDCAGMAADLFESYVITIIAAIILGVAAFVSIGKGNISARTVVFPLVIPAIGIIATVIGIFLVRARPKDKSAMAPINRGVWIAAILTIAGTAAVAGGYMHY
jgi:K(+)-stimulated pyrophosphate-energized sodium pump